MLLSAPLAPVVIPGLFTVGGVLGGAVVSNLFAERAQRKRWERDAKTEDRANRLLAAIALLKEADQAVPLALYGYLNGRPMRASLAQLAAEIEARGPAQLARAAHKLISEVTNMEDYVESHGTSVVTFLGSPTADFELLRGDFQRARENFLSALRDETDLSLS
jgi:hypothetical protein